MKKRALITGITGQDGSHLAEFLLAKGYTVYGIVRRSSSINTGRIDGIFQDPHVKNRRLILMYGDLNDASSINRTLKLVKPHEIYNLAAQSHVKVSFEIPEYTAEVTGLGTLRILEAIRESKMDHVRFYQASSSELYGRAPAPQNETTPFEPVSPYAVAKLFAYWTTRNYRESYGMYACNGILFNHGEIDRMRTAYEAKLSSVQQRMAEMSRELAKKDENVLASQAGYENQIKALTQQNAAFSSEVEMLRQERSLLHDQIQAQANDKRQYEAALKTRDELEQSVGQIRQDLEARNRSYGELERQIAAVGQERSKFTEQIQALTQQRDEAVKQLENLRAENIQLVEANQKRQDKTAQIRGFEKQIEALNAKLQQESQALTNARANETRLKEQIDRMNETLSSISTNYEAPKAGPGSGAHVAQLERENKELSEQVRSLYATQERLTQIISTQQGLLNQKPAAASTGTAIPKPEAAVSPFANVKSLPALVGSRMMQIETGPAVKPVPAALNGKPTIPSKVIMIRPEYDYLILSTKAFEKVEKGMSILISKEGVPVYQVEIQSVDGSNISTAKITRRLAGAPDLTKGEACEAVILPAGYNAI